MTRPRQASPFAAIPHLAAVVAFAMAGGPAGAGGSAIDNDGDGRYSLEELQVFYPTLTESAYGAIDTNGDGAVSPAEFRRGQDNGQLPRPVPAEG